VGTIGFVGSGNMAEALIKGVINAKVYSPENIFISDIRAERIEFLAEKYNVCLLYTSPSPRDRTRSRMPSSA